MTTHPILGPIAPVESLGRATLEAIESSGGCSVSAELAGINARGLAITANRRWIGVLLRLFWIAAAVYFAIAAYGKYGVRP